MKLACLASLLILPLAAEVLTLAGPANARQGIPVVIQVNYSGSAAAGLQWDLSGLPKGASIAIASGPSGAGKVLSCRQDFTRCVEYGMNQAVIPAGSVAIISFNMPPQNVTLSMSAVLGAAPNGSAIAVGGAAITIPLLKKAGPKRSWSCEEGMSRKTAAACSAFLPSTEAV